MTWIESGLKVASDFVWGPVMLALMLGVGIYLTVGLKAMPWRKIPRAFRELWIGKRPEGQGMIGMLGSYIVTFGLIVFRITREYFG
ncbi:MAG: hypothetical protein LJE91_02905 [Gammaproteobacteria bacterium]|jgi:AGCS family alanine or glycine:cation symporter|nr:hypothetical protein [Gammaproteobacteria bacterium]